MFGRMNAYKGLDVLLAAARRWGGGVPVTVVGAGAELDRLAPALRAAGVTVTTGRVPQDALAALVTRHAAALLPYQDATGSGVAATALGLGRPVIATRVGALAETVRDGVDGLLIPPGDAEALAAGGAALAGDPNLAERLAAGARAAADGPLGWRAVAATTRAIYQDVTRAR